MHSSRYCKFHYHEGESEHWGLLDRKSFAHKGAKPHFTPDTPLIPQHLKLELHFNWDEERVWGTTVHELLVKGLGVCEIRLDAMQLEISKMVLGSRAVEFENTGEHLVIALPKALKPGSRIKVAIDHSVRQPSAGIYFTKPDASYPDRFKTVWTQGQDEDSRYYFPCLDQPNFKQTTEVILHLPKGMFGLSNGRLIKKQTTAKEAVYHYKMEMPYSTYLFSIVGGEFAEHRSRVGKTDVRWYVQKGREKEGKNAFRDTARMLKFFSDYTGYPYPYEHYTQIAVPEFVFGGMENFTVTTQTDLTLHDDRAHLDGDSNGLVAHEAAHTWFGNLITAKNWSHAWLHESFATYFDALYTQHSKGEDEFRYQLLEDAETYFSEDGQYRRPIVTHIYKEPIDLFDAHLYPGGAVRLHHLKHCVGEAEFRKALAIYLKRHEFGLVETVDLVRCLEEVTARNFDEWLDQWIYRGGYPQLEVSYSWDSKNKMATLDVKQAQKSDKKDEKLLFRLPLTVAFQIGRRQETFPLEIKNEQEKFCFKLASAPSYFSLDPEYHCPCKKVKLDAPRPLLREQLKSDPNPIGRIQAAKALESKPSGEDIEALSRQLLKEKFWGVATRIASALATIGGEKARGGLIAGLKVKDAKTRLGVVRALGRFPHDLQVAVALRRVAQGDPSYRVEASALAALGRVRDKEALWILEEAIDRPSHNDMAQSAVFSALTELEDESSWDLLLQGAEYGAPRNSRGMAMMGLAHFAKRFPHFKGEAIDQLVRFARESRGTSAAVFRGKIGAIRALQSLGELAAVPALRKIAETETDGRLKRRAEDAVAAIFESSKKPEELKKIRVDVDDVIRENKSLRDRMEALEKSRDDSSGSTKKKRKGK